jgi:antitoxin (DNA-binding transcriptional repressor) of toxin-antitoxin stability system
MAVTQVDVRELPVRLAELLALAGAGTEVIVTEGNVPRARLLPLGAARTRIPGLHPGSITVADDFDAPLPEDFWAGGS